jgi:hypothetical protein
LCTFPRLGSRKSKRTRDSEPTVHEIYILGKDIQNRFPDYSLSAEATEDRCFREYLGCGAATTLLAWNMLICFKLLPESAMLLHLLWTLFFMKQYHTQEPACSTVGGSQGAINPKTLRKHVWPIILVLAGLEPWIVSLFDN